MYVVCCPVGPSVAVDIRPAFNPLSQETGLEYGGQTYILNGVGGYTVSSDSGQSQCCVNVDAPPPIPDGSILTGTWHTHAAYPGCDCENFSPEDKYTDQQVDRVDGFIITPSGDLRVDLYMNYSNPLQVTPNIIITICTGCILP